LVDFHDDGGECKAFSRKRNSYCDSSVDTDYFRCPSPKSWKFVDTKGGDYRISKQILPLAARMEKEPDPDDESLKKVDEPPPATGEATEEGEMSPKVVISEKTTETEFADMKIESPKFIAAGVKGFVPTIDAIFFDEQSEVKKKVESCSKWEDEVKGVVNLWKWGFTGVGALCSFGVAAATVCVLILGNRHTANRNKTFRFQIYTDDKRITQVVQHATKLNEAISGGRGVPMAGAHITFGGYYNGL
jgi:hypothetical protein